MQFKKYCTLLFCVISTKEFVNGKNVLILLGKCLFTIVTQYSDTLLFGYHIQCA